MYLEFLALAAVFALLVLVRKPHIALAVQFVGTPLYFWTLYKAGITPQTLLTGGLHAALVFAYLVGGFLLIRKQRVRWRLGLVDTLFLLFWMLVGLNFLAFSYGNAEALRKIVYAPFLVIAPFWGAQLMVATNSHKKFLLWAMVIPGMLLGPSVVELMDPSGLSSLTRFVPYVFEETGARNPHPFAMSYAITFLLVLVKLSEEKQKLWVRLVMLAVMTLALFMVVRAGGRSRFFNLAIATALYLLVFSRSGTVYRTVALLGAVGAIWVINNLIPETTAEYYTTILDQASDKSSSVYGRLRLYELAWEDFMDSPFLGVGIGMSGKGIGFPHNIILEVAAELGLLGMVLFVPIVVISLKHGLELARRAQSKEVRDLARAALVLAVYQFLVLQFSDRLVNSTWFYVPLGVLAYLGKRRRQYIDGALTQPGGNPR